MAPRLLALFLLLALLPPGATASEPDCPPTLPIYACTNGTNAGAVVTTPVPLLGTFYWQVGERSHVDAEEPAAHGEIYLCGFGGLGYCPAIGGVDASGEGAGVRLGSAPVVNVTTDGRVLLWTPLGPVEASPDGVVLPLTGDCVPFTPVCARSDESGTTTWGCVDAVCWSITRFADGTVGASNSVAWTYLITTVSSDGVVTHETRVCPAICYIAAATADADGVAAGYYATACIVILECLPSGFVLAGADGAAAACEDTYGNCNFVADVGADNVVVCKRAPYVPFWGPLPFLGTEWYCVPGLV